MAAEPRWGSGGGAAALLLLLLVAAASICHAASNFLPVSDAHRSAALELFAPVDGSFGSLEETSEALQSFDILGIERRTNVRGSTCSSAVEVLGSSSSPVKDVFYALKVSSLLKCDVRQSQLEAIASRLKSVPSDASSLNDFYYSIGGLVLIKNQIPVVDVLLEDADKVFQAIKALSQSDGRWRYSSDNPVSSTYAAGMALETLAGVISLASNEIGQSRIDAVKNDILKLFDSIEKYDDGTFYFDEKVDGVGPLATTSSVVQGLTAFASTASGRVKLPEDNILGLTKYFLSIGIPGDAKEFFNQVNSLSCLENSRVSVPLILALPATVVSLTNKDKLKVRVTTALGSRSPPLKVKLVRAFISGSKDASVIENQELIFDSEGAFHILDLLPTSIDVGKYTFVFEIVLQDSEDAKVYVTGGQTKVPVYISAIIKIENAEISVLDSDLGSVDTQKKLNLGKEDDVSLAANHLQKLRLSFQLSTPHGHAFKPHQAILKLKHEKAEHIFLVGNSGKKFQDFLGLVEKFFYLSGRYDIQLSIGDAVMENSFCQDLGHVELDLPEAPEKAPRPAAQPDDPFSKYGPKAEISHIFRAPEKRPSENLSLAFLALTLLPFLGFLVGLLKLGVNLKNFPSAPVPAMFAILFHVGIGSILALYALFWLKLDLFTTLKALGLLGVFVMFVGHRILSHLASTSSKLKSA
ncbi:hypothetical protein CDL15_Pgr007540 [Punica granatum]|uniref:Dolichyl-diphosphooligosaccharide--protein glycosyltransferase subunit 2 n=1 Tax=Punica granatum TaxID=22663 RepID=A0A218XAY8_PUNGR|nr:hypothetical protein CDL15_Pgr007540 [Punica granatum]